MASTNTTLVSLAILKVDLDEGFRDYIGYFENFFVSLLRKHQPDPIVTAEVAMLFQAEYGLRVPEKGVQLVLRRLARRKYLKRKDNLYHIVGDLPAMDLRSKRAAAQQHIENVYTKLKEYAKANAHLDWTDSDVDQVLLGFLSRFAVECIRAYIFSTALPESPKAKKTDQVIVSRFIRELYYKRDATFESVVVLVKGQMYANALICPDLEGIQKTFKKVTFYFDTPVVLSALGIQTEADAAATSELLALLVRLKGKLSVFTHTVEEIDTVLEYAEQNVDRPDAQGRVLTYFRDNRMKRGDIALFRGNLEDHLKKTGFKLQRTPRFSEDYQIDQAGLEQKLRDTLSYKGTRGAEHDANSVRSIFELRRGNVPRRLEDCNAVLVTNNAKFARTAFEHGKEQNSAREVSSVITDYSLANVAWLKAPLGAPDLPEKETMAACYAALEPSKPLWDKYLAELESLEEKGSITADDHALLRVSGLATDELMGLTMGDEKAFGANSVPQILDRVKNSLVAEQMKALAKAKESQADLIGQKRVMELREQRASKKLYWVSEKIAKVVTTGFSIIGLLVIGATAFGSMTLSVPWVQGSDLATSIFHGAILVGTLWAIVSGYYGIAMISLIRMVNKRIHIAMFKKLKRWLLGDS